MGAAGVLVHSVDPVRRIGFTGPPGAGKSTLVDAVLTEMRSRGDKVGVLAVDPSSPITGGALLGDRIRMQGHAGDPGVYVRSMASRGHLGGLSPAAPPAIAVMAHGPDNDVARIADSARAAQRDERVVPLLVIQGDRDDVVASVNGVGLVAQYLRFNGHPAGVAGYAPAAALPASDATTREAAPDRHPIRVDEWMRDGRVAVRHVMVEGLGHAWSGGDDRHPFADPQGPDALALFTRFAAEAAA